MNGRLRVDLAALQSNYQTFVQAGDGREVAAVVKADAYGLGCTEVARALAAVGCQRFFVATAVEGQHLRDVLVEADIYVFEGARAATAAALAAARLTPVINDQHQLEIWRDFAHLPIAIQVDTGISRLGFPLSIRPSDFAGFQLDLLLSHFACADAPEHSLNAIQRQRMDQISRLFAGVKSSFGNSAAWLTGRAWQGDVGRPGIGLFGANPYVDAGGPKLDTVARFEVPVLQLRTVTAGEYIGYGATRIAEQDMQVAVVGCGYADGIPRLLSNQGSLGWRGQRCPIVGRVSMDLTVVDVSECEQQPVADDWLECFGDLIRVEEVADWALTISYEVFTGIRPRVARHYHWG